MKRPSFQFYPKDWLADLGLRSLSPAARGLWADLLCLMHDGIPYGHLSANGRPVSDPVAARLTGLSESEYLTLLGEIETHGVASRTKGGILFSRRMVRDEEIRTIRANVGHVGGVVAQAKRQANAKQMVKQTTKQMVAAAEEDAEAEGSSGKGSGENLMPGLPSEYQTDYQAIRRACRVAQSFDLEMATLLAGKHPNAEGATPEDVGRGLRELALSGEPIKGLARWVMVARAKRLNPTNGAVGPENEFDRLRRLNREGKWPTR